MPRRTLELFGSTTVVAGHSVTPVARVTTTAIAGRRGGFVSQRIRPAQVRVTGTDGKSRTVRIRDAERILRLGVVIICGALVVLRRRRRAT
ncbi:MAG: hypothetical protein M5U31_04695 [Acidimicrobiia bacterium]|nr:hypothetical protein [Acidimicrobiia bacterium]